MSSIEPAVFSREWVAAWNCSDVEAILAHYADDVVFVSPLAATVTGGAEVHGKISCVLIGPQPFVVVLRRFGSGSNRLFGMTKTAYF